MVSRSVRPASHEVVFGVGASERLEPRSATDDGTRGQAVLHSEKHLLAKVLRPGESRRTARRHWPGGPHRPGGRSPFGPRAAGTEHKLATMSDGERLPPAGDIILSQF